MVSKKTIDNLSTNDNDFFAEISALLRSGRVTAYRAVNSVMVDTYWQMGRRIVEQEQQGRARAGYGEQLMVQLSRYLTGSFGKGFSIANLRNIRQFYFMFPDFDQFTRQRLANLSWSHFCLIIRSEKLTRQDIG